MVQSRVYLDHNATAPVRPDAWAAFEAALGAGNPSSVHREGRAGRALVERARDDLAALLGVRSDAVVFTSGGTESNTMALRPGALRTADGPVPTRLLIGATEHASVLHGHGFPPGSVEHLGVDRHGIIDLDALDLALARSGGARPLVAVQLANGETGVVQPIAEIAARVHATGGVLHVDAVQAFGRMRVDMGALGADSLAVSAHKLGGVPGSGALVVAPGREGRLALVCGGGQERGRRAGTENAPAIAAFAAAARAAADGLGSEVVRLTALRDGCEREVLRLAPDATVFGRTAPRLPNTLAFAVPGLAAETALIALDLDGVAVSSGSACSSGKVAPSQVLAAMGMPADLARGAIRVSLGWSSSHEDVARFLRAFEILLQRLYVRRMARAA